MRTHPSTPRPLRWALLALASALCAWSLVGCTGTVSSSLPIDIVVSDQGSSGGPQLQTISTQAIDPSSSSYDPSAAIQTLPLNQPPVGLANAPDGQTLYVGFPDTIALYNDALQQTGSISLPSGCSLQSFSINGAGTWLAGLLQCSGQPQLWVTSLSNPATLYQQGSPNAFSFSVSSGGGPGALPYAIGDSALYFVTGSPAGGGTTLFQTVQLPISNNSSPLVNSNGTALTSAANDLSSYQGQGVVATDSAVSAVSAGQLGSSLIPSGAQRIFRGYGISVLAAFSVSSTTGVAQLSFLSPNGSATLSSNNLGTSPLPGSIAAMTFTPDGYAWFFDPQGNLWRVDVSVLHGSVLSTAVRTTSLPIYGVNGLAWLTESAAP
jgi:hypothetical protein